MFGADPLITACEMSEVRPLTMSQKQKQSLHGTTPAWRHGAPLPPPPAAALCSHAQDAYRRLSPAIALLLVAASLEVIAQK